MFICNKETYGHLPVPLRTHSTLQDEADSFLHALLEVNGKLPLYKEKISLLIVSFSVIMIHVLLTVRNPPVEPSRYLPKLVKKPDKMGFDEVNLISGYGVVWHFLKNIQYDNVLFSSVDIHGQPEEKGRPPRAHAEGTARARD